MSYQELSHGLRVWVEGYCEGCSRFKAKKCTLKKPTSCSIKGLWALLNESQGIDKPNINSLSTDFQQNNKSKEVKQL